VPLVHHGLKDGDLRWIDGRPRFILATTTVVSTGVRHSDSPYADAAPRGPGS
jgi:hypothetical protein